MELEDLMKAAMSDDFGSKLQALKDREQAAREAEKSLAAARGNLDSKSENLAVREAEIDKRESRLASEFSGLDRQRGELEDVRAKLAAAETAVREREAAAGQKESATKAKGQRLNAEIAAAANERLKYERRMTYLDGYEASGERRLPLPWRADRAVRVKVKNDTADAMPVYGCGDLVLRPGDHAEFQSDGEAWAMVGGSVS